MAVEDTRRPEHEAGTAHGHPYVVRVTGDMDVEHVAELRAALAAALDEAPDGAEITVDLRNSSFCDSAGLNALLEARRRGEESGHVIRLAAPSHQLLRLLDYTGTTGRFPLDPAVPG
ncbi:STAS domain-containing protein [Streptomyces sp. NPDC047014]|uniref:STAS domain-containing protein n=1 Tax=Streptomyces sp. NPDC047014 TaxID=3155736 RepID=UPI0033EB5E70